jgi:hypothetical protein
LTEEKQNSDLAIREILRANHPIFAQLRQVLAIQYRVYFTTRTEFSQWIKVARAFAPVGSGEWDDPEHEEWIRHEAGKPSKLLKIATSVFDERGFLVIYTAQQWRADWISLSDYEPPQEAPTVGEGITDDDVPF